MLSAQAPLVCTVAVTCRPVNCDECEEDKSVHLTKIVGGKAESHVVCPGCPKLEVGVGPPAMSGGKAEGAKPSGTKLPAASETEPAQAAAPFSLKAFLAGIKPAPERPQTEQVLCPACGMSFDDFRQSGRLGCHHDYETFNVGLVRLLNKIHGATQHVGRVPSRAGERLKQAELLEALRAELEEAVKREDYERAAELRDEIRASE